VSTTKPFRYSIKTWLAYASFDDLPWFRASRASGSVVEACVWFTGRSPRKSTVGFFGPRG
jgi:hypothetical protein